ncbi:MAG TPA: hypothetical protein QF761_03830, partial [Pirellulales bacterium]|nr:hypothetical protein [Pirellulales bacterium]
AACFWMMRKGHARGMVLSFALMAVLLSVSVFSFVMPRIDRHRTRFILTELVQQSGPETKMGAYGFFEPGLVFYTGRTVRPLLRGAPLAATPDENTDSHSASNRATTVAPFLQQESPAMLITTGSGYEQIADLLPPGVEILSEVPRFLRSGTLVLLGRPEVLHQATTPNRTLR